MEPLSRTLQTNVGINTLEEDVYFYGYSPSQASLQYATSYQREDNYHDNHYPTTSSRQPAWRASLYEEILYLREQVTLFEKRLQELQLSQRRTTENDQLCYTSPVNTSTINRLTPCHMPIRHHQYQQQKVYLRRRQKYREESENGYIDPEVYQPRRSTYHTEPSYSKPRSLHTSTPCYPRNTVLTVTNNREDLNIFISDLNKSHSIPTSSKDGKKKFDDFSKYYYFQHQDGLKHYLV